MYTKASGFVVFVISCSEDVSSAFQCLLFVSSERQIAAHVLRMRSLCTRRGRDQSIVLFSSAVSSSSVSSIAEFCHSLVGFSFLL